MKKRHRLCQPQKPRLAELVNQVTKVEAIDAHADGQFRAEKLYYPFLHDMSLVRPLRFLSPASFPASGNTAEGIKAPAGTGPGKWQKLAKANLTASSNPNYWGAKPAYEEISKCYPTLTPAHWRWNLSGRFGLWQRPASTPMWCTL